MSTKPQVGSRCPPTLWAAAGCPDPRKPTVSAPVGACYWCGGQLGGLACRVKDVCGSSFTDHDVALLPSSPHVCRGCAWSMTGRPPDTLRLWSVLWQESGQPLPPNHEKAPDLGASIHLQNKADPSAFVAALSDPPAGPWVVSIADSGQIHVAPFAVVNVGSGPWCVRFEREDVRAHPAVFRELHRAVVACMDAGIRKASILEGDMTVMQWRNPECRAAWGANEPILSRHRGGALMRLVVFLARRTNQGEKR